MRFVAASVALCRFDRRPQEFMSFFKLRESLSYMNYITIVSNKYEGSESTIIGLIGEFIRLALCSGMLHAT